jgi:hypothetical protein
VRFACLGDAAEAGPDVRRANSLGDRGGDANRFRGFQGPCPVQIGGRNLPPWDRERVKVTLQTFQPGRSVETTSSETIKIIKIV